MTQEKNTPAADPDGWTIFGSMLLFLFVAIPVLAVLAALSVRLTIWLLIALGLLP